MTSREHQREHDLIDEAIREGWREMDYARMLVHLAGRHGLTVKDVNNAGLVLLQQWHDAMHGGGS